MAYNSDGYIMIDFTEVDFRRTNQTIEGLYKRCKDVIGTNKFVIVINANNKTPLPSTVCITNGQYVIESVLYTFAISSNDNLHITKKTTPEELIDDDHVTLKTTFSSNKISSLYDEVKIKSFNYTGDDGTPCNIHFPTAPKMILGVFAYVNNNVSYNMLPTPANAVKGCVYALYIYSQTPAPAMRNVNMSYDDVNNILTIDGANINFSLNIRNVTYTVYYI